MDEKIKKLKERIKMNEKIKELIEKIETDSDTIFRLKKEVVHYALKVNEKNNELIKQLHLIEEIERLHIRYSNGTITPLSFGLELKAILKKMEFTVK